ncbi:tyrosine-type recombinase/integrase [Xenorhabdus bovienii]|nr:tyrosine-type recombinase/integrase [Xenorhabdus bovienii]MDE9462404.1 tyrosine-type recombinase/integrase [Xenorhabdus bovienii]MDE9470333.1 tyrosine-type recombinase/integrase [Xenorhabdus bovienii]
MSNYAHVSLNELSEFLCSINKYIGSQIVRAALRILILTGVRPRELRKVEWFEINLDKAAWKISAEKMKMRCPYIVLLPEQTINLLRKIHLI